MNLYEIEEKRKQDEKNNKINKIIVISIIIVTILTIAIYFCIYYLKNNPSTVTATIDGKVSNNIASLLVNKTNVIDADTAFIPIKEIASYLGYSDFSGGYTSDYESNEKCYVKNENEVAIFSLDSDVIYKLDLTIEGADYEKVRIDKKVTMNNGQLCISKQGLEKAFNVKYNYDSKTKKLEIFTLNYYEAQESKKIKQYKYEPIEEELFINKKAMLDNMIVVKSSQGLYGVINYSDGGKIIDAQYDSITYIPQMLAYSVKKQGKVGIIGVAGEVKTRIGISYDSLTLIDDEKELYLAESNGLFGIIDINENIIIYLEYDKIGIDASPFKENDIKKGYILLDKLIPVQKNNKWGFFNIDKGKFVTNFEFENIGCILNKKQSSVYNLLIIDDYDLIVIGKDGLYGCIDTTGKISVPYAGDKMYLEISSGKKLFYVAKENKNGNEMKRDVVEYIEAIKANEQNAKKNQTENTSNETVEENKIEQNVNEINIIESNTAESNTVDTNAVEINTENEESKEQQNKSILSIFSGGQ